MAIGLKYGRTEASDDENKEKTYELTNLFMEKFKAKHGTLICRDLLGADFNTEEGKKKLEEENLVENRCPIFVETAADILEEIKNQATTMNEVSVTEEDSKDLPTLL